MARVRPDIETWETTGDSHVVVNRYDSKGNVKGVDIGGRSGMRVQVTHDEREELNEDLAASDDLCIFRNGMLRPVRGVPDDVMQRFEQETKPHGGLTTEELVEAIETKKGNAFKSWVSKLNEATVRRLQTLAPEADASASQLTMISEALEPFQVRQLRETEADRQLRREPNMASA